MLNKGLITSGPPAITICHAENDHDFHTSQEQYVDNKKNKG